MVWGFSHTCLAGCFFAVSTPGDIFGRLGSQLPASLIAAIASEVVVPVSEPPMGAS